MGKVFVGIDPGLTGALAAVNEKGEFVEVHDCPVATGGKRIEYDDLEMAGILKTMTLKGAYIVAIEAQRARPGNGVSSMLKLGLGYGLWRGAVAALRLRSTIVEPKTWIREMGAGKEKRDHVLAAKRLFPSEWSYLLKSKHGRADALLIAEWARRKYYGEYCGEGTGGE